MMKKQVAPSYLDSIEIAQVGPKTTSNQQNDFKSTDLLQIKQEAWPSLLVGDTPAKPCGL